MYILGRGWILNHMNLHQRQRNLKSACGKTRLNLEFKCGASPWEVPIFNNCNNLYIGIYMSTPCQPEPPRVYEA